MDEPKLKTAQELAALSSADIEQLMTDYFVAHAKPIREGSETIIFSLAPKEYREAFLRAQEREQRMAKEKREYIEGTGIDTNPFAPPKK